MDIRIQGRIKLDVIRKGKIIDSTGWLKNIITNPGKAEVANLIGNVSSPTAFTYLAVGTSATAVSAADTTLGAEVTTNGLSRAVATRTRVTTSVSNDTVQFTYTWSASGSVSVEEVGVLNAVSGGILLGHALTGTKAVASGDILQGTYQVQLS